MKRLLAAACAVLALTVTVACGGGSTPKTSTPEGSALQTPSTTPKPTLPVTVHSDDGREVTITDVSRIVPLFADINEMIFQLGLGDNVVARDVSATFAQASDLPVVTRAHDISAEAVLSLKPTVVFADDFIGPPEALDQIRSVGVPVVVFKRPTKMRDITTNITAIAAALGVPDAGAKLAAKTQADIDRVIATIPDGADKPRVAFLYLRGQAGVALLGGPGSGPDSLIEAVGGIDAGTAIGLTEAFTPITSEALVKAAPDVLLLTTTGLESVGGKAGLREMPGIAQTPAGKNGKVIAVEDGLLFSFGARTPDALTQIIDQLYGS